MSENPSAAPNMSTLRVSIFLSRRLWESVWGSHLLSFGKIFCPKMALPKKPFLEMGICLFFLASGDLGWGPWKCSCHYENTVKHIARYQKFNGRATDLS